MSLRLPLRQWSKQMRTRRNDSSRVAVIPMALRNCPRGRLDRLLSGVFTVIRAWLGFWWSECRFLALTQVMMSAEDGSTMSASLHCCAECFRSQDSWSLGCY
jgi:hypothetical protein